jgi:hypothetical protein
VTGETLRVTGEDTVVRYVDGRRKRAYFRCPVKGCGELIRKDGAQSTRAIREHRASHA